MTTVKELREMLRHLPDDHTVVVSVPNAPVKSPQVIHSPAKIYWEPKSEWFIFEVML